MAKRSSGQFERVEKDFYRTPPEAVLPLLPFLERHTTFVEPCAGDGILADTLVGHGHICHAAFDIDPKAPGIRRGDARRVRWATKRGVWITNPPWTRSILHPLITHLSAQAPLWMLFDADWLHTRQATPFLPLLRKVVSVGRVKWIEDTDMMGKDNSMWALFDGTRPRSFTEFHGRT